MVDYSVPTWLYKPVPVSAEMLKQIQHELSTLLETTIMDYKKHPGMFSFSTVEIVRDMSPTYCELLKNLKIYDRWSECGVATSNGSKSMSIHVDDSRKRCFAFNIPLLNCENSYTVWYRGLNPRPLPEPTIHKGALVYDYNSPEIGRMSATTCAFVNVGIPHKPVNYNSLYRAVFSSRFDPELFDYFLSHDAAGVATGPSTQ